MDILSKFPSSDILSLHIVTLAVEVVKHARIMQIRSSYGLEGLH